MYYLVVGTFSSIDNAFKYCGCISNLIGKSLVIQKNGQFMVIFSSYYDKDTAENAKTLLNDIIDCYIYKE